jgi:hypothetical protein
MIFIVGVNHEIQYWFEGCSASTKEFKKYLETEVVNRNITLIAEELSNETISNEAISKHNAAIDSVARVVASSKGSKHQFCDPDSKVRKDLGIPCHDKISNDQIKKKLGLKLTGGLSPQEAKVFYEEYAKYHSVREEYWFSLIKDCVCSNVIFICGDNHVENFHKLVIKKGCQAEVLSRDWKIKE